MPRHCAIYARISQDRVGAGLGVARQQEDCEKVAERKRWTVAEVFTDNDLSAYSGKPRPGYRAMLQAIRDGRVDAVVAWHTDRLHRSPRELEEFIDLCERHNVAVETAQAGPLDLSSSSGRMTARITGAVARHESEHKAERIRRANRQRAESGRPHGRGNRPYGYEVDGVTPVPSEAKVVREMARRLLAGETLYGIASDLNRRGSLTTGGRPWVASTVRQTLLRPRYAGLLLYRGEIVGKGRWPRVITVAQHEAIVAKLSDPARRTITTNARRHLLSGIARCGVCQLPLRVGHGVHDGNVYRCQNGAHVSRHQGHVDTYVTETVIAYLSKPGFVEAFGRTAPETDTVTDEIAAVKANRDTLVDQHADNPYDEATFRRMLARADDRLAALRAQLAATTGRTALAAFTGRRDPRKVWAGLTLHQRRAVIDACVTVTVERAPRGRGFHPEYVTVTPRGGEPPAPRGRASGTSTRSPRVPRVRGAS